MALNNHSRDGTLPVVKDQNDNRQFQVDSQNKAGGEINTRANATAISNLTKLESALSNEGLNRTQMACMPLGVAYSPEDTLNNDFFYDDEFSVPFDANLSESSAKSDSPLDLGDPEYVGIIQDMGNLARVSRGKEHVTVTDNKVDSEDGQPREDVPEEDLNTSDLTCSAISDNHPLFSPSPTPTGPLAQSTTTDLDENSSSYEKEEQTHYDFDWKSTANRYIISFDRAALQCSADSTSSADSHHDVSETKRLTTWAGLTRGGWSPKSSESSYDNVPLSSTPTPPSEMSSSRTRKSSSPLITWQAVTSPSSTRSPASHRISWTCSEPANTTLESATDRDCYLKEKSQSLPEVRSRRLGFVEHFTSSRENSDTRGTYCKERSSKRPGKTKYLGHNSKLSSDESECVTDGAHGDECSPLSPTAVRRLTGTWSMSSMESGKHSWMGSPQQSQNLDVNPVTELKTWLARQNLNEFLSDSSATNSSDLLKKYTFQKTDSIQLCSKCCQNPALAGKHVSVQFPSMKQNVSSQTSPTGNSCPNLTQSATNFSTGNDKQSKASALPKVKSCPRFVHPESVLKKALDTVSSPRKARDRYACHLLYHKGKLPDLSFLNGKIDKTPAELRRYFHRSSSVPSRITRSCQTDPVLFTVPPPKPPRRSVSISPTSSREISPHPGAVAQAILRKRSNSQSSFCSSSSSGIDAGHTSSESQLHRLALTAGRAFTLTLNDPDPTLQPYPPAAQPQSFPNNVQLCPDCMQQVQATASSSIIIVVNSSQPQLFSADQNLTMPSSNSSHQADPSSTSSDTISITKCSSEESIKKPVNKDVARVVTMEGVVSPGASDMSEASSLEVVEEDDSRRPLKSCLRRRGVRDKHSVTLKHRSWSDPYDATILHYSQDGEARYQLLTNTAGHPCWVKMATPAPALTPVADEALSVATPMESSPATSVATPNVDSSSPSGNSEQHSFHSSDDDTVIAGSGPAPRTEDASSGDTSLTQIPMPACDSGTVHAVLHSSSDDSSDPGSDALKKKSVSFSERVFYHSPHGSPRRSASEGERLRVNLPLSVTPVTVSELNEWTSANGKECHFGEAAMLQSGGSTISSSSLPELEQKLWLQKLELVNSVEQAAQTVLASCMCEENELVRRASSMCNPAIGDLVLDVLCPPLVALVTDGLYPTTRSLFGKVKNSAWRVSQESVARGAVSKGIFTLIKDLEQLDLLNSPSLKFHAFIFGLLNHRCLDFWVAYLCHHESLTLTDYTPSAFVSLSQTLLRPLFIRLTTALQPLARIPFRLEYTFEYHRNKTREQEMYADFLLRKHTSSSNDERINKVLLHNGGLSRHLSVDDALQLLNRSQTSDGLTQSLSASWKMPTSSSPTLSDARKFIFTTGQQIKDKLKGEKQAGEKQQQTKTRRDDVPVAATYLPRSASEEDIPRCRTPPRRTQTSPRRTQTSPRRTESWGDVWTAIGQKFMNFKSSVEDLTGSGQRSDEQKDWYRSELHMEPVQVVHSAVSMSTSNSTFTSEETNEELGKANEGTGPSVKVSHLQGTAEQNTGPAEATAGRDACTENPGSVEPVIGNPAATKKPVAVGSFNKTAEFLKRKLAPSLAGMFDRFMGDKKFTKGSKVNSVTTDVKRSVSSPEFRKKYAQALCHYVASSDDQLSFEKGNLLLVVKDLDTDWLLCRSGDHTGNVHKGCVKLAASS